MARMILAVVAGLLTASPYLPAPAPAHATHRSAHGAPSTPRAKHAQRVGAGGWMSGNWSGYALTRGTYSGVSATWVVPAVEATTSPTYSAIWIGIGGFEDSGLIQLGTEQDFSGGGRYYAWWEILPSAEVRIDSITIRPGDRMAGSITRGSGNTWTISLENQSSGRSFSVSRPYTGSQRSAEWILEAPDIGNTPADLAHYSRTTVSPVAVNGMSPGLTSSDGGVMVQHGRQVSTPSDPSLSGDTFAVAYGPDKPAAPSLF